MVGCDNDECKYEWFHYECVGLKEAPPQDQKWWVHMSPAVTKVLKCRVQGLIVGVPNLLCGSLTTHRSEVQKLIINSCLITSSALS